MLFWGGLISSDIQLCLCFGAMFEIKGHLCWQLCWEKLIGTAKEESLIKYRLQLNGNTLGWL